MSPEILFGIGVLLLLAGLIYGTMQWSARRRSSDSARNQATKDLYRETERNSVD